MKFKIISYNDKEIFELKLEKFCNKVLVLKTEYSTSCNRYDEVVHSALIAYESLNKGE